METLMQLLAERSAQQLVYSGLAREIQVSVDTVKRWIDLLARLHYGFMVRPWLTNVAKALRKEPKSFQRDWSGVWASSQKVQTARRASRNLLRRSSLFRPVYRCLHERLLEVQRALVHAPYRDRGVGRRTG
jgi:predicted AAA+ superfamily ATPase